jgi:2-hydroxy-3-oxopropionate reductase
MEAPDGRPRRMSMASGKPALGFIGLGAMGGRICRNLLQAGYTVTAFDIIPERVRACVEAGAVPARNAGEVARGAGVILTSLPSAEAFIEVAERSLLPNIRPGQVVVDLGTNTAPDARRLAEAFAKKDATLLDAPVSGGTRGAETGTLRVFAAGEAAAVERCRPLLDVIGDPAYVVYCGPSGAGHVVKGVNQLAMGLGDAAYLEAVAFGSLAGVDPVTIARAVGGSGGWRQHFGSIAQRVAEGKGLDVGVKFGQLHYFLEEAQEQGFVLPLTEALHDFCAAGERIVMEVNRLSPSYWHELHLAAERLPEPDSAALAQHQAQRKEQSHASQSTT